MKNSTYRKLLEVVNIYISTWWEDDAIITEIMSSIPGIEYIDHSARLLFKVDGEYYKIDLLENQNVREQKLYIFTKQKCPELLQYLAKISYVNRFVSKVEFIPNMTEEDKQKTFNYFYGKVTEIIGRFERNGIFINDILNNHANYRIYDDKVVLIDYAQNNLKISIDTVALP